MIQSVFNRRLLKTLQIMIAMEKNDPQ